MDGSEERKLYEHLQPSDLFLRFSRAFGLRQYNKQMELKGNVNFQILGEEKLKISELTRSTSRRPRHIPLHSLGRTGQLQHEWREK